MEKIRRLWLVLLTVVMLITRAMSGENIDKLSEIHQAESPVIYPDADTFVLSASLEISSPIPAATIYYTLDGNDPTKNSLSISSGDHLVIVDIGQTVVKACAYVDSLMLSDITSKTITILDRLKSPIFSPPGNAGIYVGDLSLHFSCGTSTVAGRSAENVPTTMVYYTDDGVSTPTTKSTRYAPCGGTITLFAPGAYIVRAIAAAPGVAPSAIIQQEFQLRLAAYEEQPCRQSLNRYTARPHVSLDTIVFERKQTGGCNGAIECNVTSNAVAGKIAVLHNPIGHFNIIPPTGGSCAVGSALADARLTARAYDYDLAVAEQQRRLTTYEKQVLLAGSSSADWQRWQQDYVNLRHTEAGCEIAASAGYFDAITHACFGATVSEGTVLSGSSPSVSDTGLHVHMGMRNGSIVTGRVPTSEINSINQPFSWLVSGSGWLVRNGRSYIADSISLDAEDASHMQQPADFLEGKYARTLLGHDLDGRLLILYISGTGADGSGGMSLSDAATWAAELGFQNAINLVGDTRATLVQQGVVVSSAAGPCDINDLAGIHAALARCEQQVSTVACVHVMAPLAGERPATAPISAPIVSSTPSAQPSKQPTAWPSYDWAASDDRQAPMLNTSLKAQTVASLQARLSFFQKCTLSLGTACVLLLFMLAYSCASTVTRGRHGAADGAIELGGLHKGIQFSERRVQDAQRGITRPGVGLGAGPQIVISPEPGEADSSFGSASRSSAYHLHAGSAAPSNKLGGIANRPGVTLGSGSGGRWQDRLGSLTLESDSDSDTGVEVVHFRGKGVSSGVMSKAGSRTTGKKSSGSSGGKKAPPCPTQVHSPLPVSAAAVSRQASAPAVVAAAATTSYVRLESDDDEELNPFSSHA